MTSAVDHAPPDGRYPTSVTDCGAESVTPIRRSFPAAKNAIERLSGDQNGRNGVFSPPEARGARSTRDCAAQSCGEPVLSSRATKTRCVPSGEMTAPTRSRGSDGAS
jgi:hypothetical protein